MKYPKTLGTCVDKLYRMREKRLEVQRADEVLLKKLKADEAAMEDHILETFTKDKLEGARGKIAAVSISRTVVPNVEDHDAFLKYVFKKKAFDLLTKAVCRAAVRERWDDGKAVPGIGKFVKLGLSLRKR